LGAGKSEALRLLAELGAATLSTDAVTHELLQTEQPMAVLIAAAGLTRRDLDLGLTHAAVLPERPSEQQRAVLRGA
jgi:dephospho-CoA kinase